MEDCKNGLKLAYTALLPIKVAFRVKSEDAVTSTAEEFLIQGVQETGYKSLDIGVVSTFVIPPLKCLASEFRWVLIELLFCFSVILSDLMIIVMNCSSVFR